MKLASVVLGLLLAVPAVAQEPPSAADLVAEAAQKRAAGDLEGAAEALRKATRSGAGGEAWLALGEVLEAQADLDNAMDAYRSAAEALAAPANGEPLAHLALLQELRGIGAAAETAAAALAADASGGLALAAAARARAREGKGDEALELAQRAVAAGVGPIGTAAVGRAQEVRGDLVAAEAAYREALAAAPESFAATIGLARVLRQSDRAAEAAPLLATVIEKAPGAVAAYKESARVRIALGQPDQALGDAATAEALAENDPDATALAHEVQIARALAYIPANQANLAVDELVRLRDEHPELAAARLALAKAQIATQQLDQAVVELQKAAELDPTLAEAYYELGHLRHVLKRDAKGALEPYEKAVAAAPGNLVYRTNLGAVLAELGQADRAVEELTKVVETPSYDRPEAWIYLGGAQLAAKRYKDAVAALTRGVEKAPQSPQAEAYLAWSYFGLKDADNFKAHARKAKSLGYKDATLDDYLKRIEAGEPIK
jgi:tetratricopeptide (TPR) repeat protein